VKFHAGLDSSADSSTTSDEAGRFQFRDIKAGSYFPIAEAAGYHHVLAVVHGQRQSTDVVNSVVVKPNDRIEGIRILMAKNAVIAGRVLDESGEPIQGARVEAWPLPEDHPAIAREGQRETADAHGEYRLIVTPGEYRVTAKAPSPRRITGTHIVSSQIIHFSARHETGTVVRAVENAETSPDIHLKAKTGLSISGKVTGRPTDGSGLLDLHVESGSSAEALDYVRLYRFKPADRFELTGLPPEFYRVYATYTAPQISLHSQVLEFTLNSTNGKQLDLALAPGFSLIGTVDGPPVGRFVRELYLRSATLPQHSSSGFYVAHIRDGGAFEIPGMVPDRYRLELPPRSQMYIKQVLFESQELKDGILDLRSGSSESVLKIILSDKVGRLTVKPIDANGRPSEEGTVFLMPDGKFNPAEAYFMRWSAGATRGFDNLPPGKYRVIWTFEPFPGLDSDRVRQFAETAETVEIREGDDLTEVLRLPERSSLRFNRR
jgi:hypothetical protein